MTLEIKNKTRDQVHLIIMTVLFLALSVLISFCNRFGFSMFNGVIAAFQYGVCLLMLKYDRNKGVRLAIVLMIIALASVSFAFIMSKQIGLLPGIFNNIFYIVTLVLLYKYYKRREIESITDMLTGVYNRRGLYNHLIEKIDDRKPFCVAYFSVDNFKIINDNYGHAYGDALIRRISAQIKEKIGTNGEVARIGGAEFAITLSQDEDYEQIVNEILQNMRDSSDVADSDVGYNCYVTCYAGVSKYPQDATDYESLIKYADIAMYRAKKQKAHNAYTFNDDMAKALVRQMEVQELIKQGLEKDYFYLVYQPQYKTSDKKLRGFETLIRMKTPQGDMISPGEFIPVAEKNELILQIDNYVLRRAMTEFKDVCDVNKDLTISVNVSAKNMCSPGFVDYVKKILKDTGFSPKNLEIEITEYCLVDSMEQTTANIVELRELGIQVALDDFGTGYTSLSYVSTLPINLLKIDKSLVDDIQNDEKRRQFVQVVIVLGHLMGVEVIAEGVEDELQLDKLRYDECDFVQGFVWGKPMELTDAKKLAEK